MTWRPRSGQLQQVTPVCVNAPAWRKAHQVMQPNARVWVLVQVSPYGAVTGGKGQM